MCWVCDQKSRIAENYWASELAATIHFSSTKATEDIWLTGHELAPQQPVALILIGDSVPDDTSTTETITVDGPHIIGTTETIGDQDFYQVELVAGQSYEIGMYAYTGGPGGIPQADAYVEIYDADGNLLVAGDGGASTPYNNANSGFDVLMTFTPQTSGVYYVNARAYDEVPENGTTGDTVGDYELFVQTASPFAYQPYYDPSHPLYALDWGSQVDGSSRNPDGEEGPRPTENEHTGYAWNPYGIEGKNVIYYYFAKEGEVFISDDPTTPGLENMVAAGFRDWEKNAYEMALDEYEKVADIVYIEVDNRHEADFIFITYDGTPDVGVLGRMSPPDEQNEGQTEFNRNGPGWNEEALKPGGFSFQTLMHELGHGHGMAHPHDGGGRSGVLRGVEAEGTAFDYTTGDYNLNQGVYTIMSYEDGWRPGSEAKNDTDGDGTAERGGTRPAAHGAPPTSSTYGWVGSLSAFDIAVIQDKYGVNEEWATGDDTYVLRDENTDGTFYSSIWDGGGNDIIVYSGSRDANIDLRAATLQYEFGGGGWMSYALGIHGGFTIANGVTIENARSGEGRDTLIGNDAANNLAASGGDDRVFAGGGDDRVFGGDGADHLLGEAGSDRLFGGLGDDILSGGGGNDIAEGMDGDDLIYGGVGADHLLGGAGDDNLHGGTGHDILSGGAHNDILLGEDGDDLLYGGDGNDQLIGGLGDDRLFGGSGSDMLSGKDGNDLIEGGADTDLLYGGAGADILNGGDGNDRLFGSDGDDQLFGRAGTDVLDGGLGRDGFYFDTALDAETNVDRIADFSVEDDTIFLDNAVFVGLAAGALAGNAFVIGGGAQDADDRIIYNAGNGALYFDPDGTGAAAAVQFATLDAGLNLAATDFVVI